MDYGVGGSRMYVLVNESSGQACHLDARTGAVIGSRSVCYRSKKKLSERFPDQQYAVYKLVRLVRKATGG